MKLTLLGLLASFNAEKAYPHIKSSRQTTHVISVNRQINPLKAELILINASISHLQALIDSPNTHATEAIRGISVQEIHDYEIQARDIEARIGRTTDYDSNGR